MISKKTPGDSNMQSKLGNNALKTRIPASLFFPRWYHLLPWIFILIITKFI